MQERDETDGLMTPTERQRVMNGTRLQAILTVLVVFPLVAMDGLVFWLPSIHADLEWKAQRGATELATAANLSMVVEDPGAIRAALGSYPNHDGVKGIIATGAEDRSC